MNETSVYIDRSDVHEGKRDELKAGIRTSPGLPTGRRCTCAPDQPGDCA
jgi:hypothetical protein